MLAGGILPALPVTLTVIYELKLDETKCFSVCCDGHAISVSGAVTGLLIIRTGEWTSLEEPRFKLQGYVLDRLYPSVSLLT